MLAGLSPWRGDAPLLLASASPTRRALLEAAGLPVETEPSDLDERALEAALGDVTPADLARHLARAKTVAVAARHPGRVVLGADQVGELDGRALSKVATRDEARRQLHALAGRSHRLHSVAAIALAGEIVGEVSDTATLTLRPLDEASIEHYLDLVGEAVFASVGGYQIERLGIHLMSRIVGDHATILGLPLLGVLARMRSLGLLAL